MAQKRSNKYTVHVSEGECCVVIPTVWAQHILSVYKELMLDAYDDDEAQIFKSFLDLIESQVEETAVEFYE